MRVVEDELRCFKADSVLHDFGPVLCFIPLKTHRHLCTLQHNNERRRGTKPPGRALIVGRT
jgi:hypothetical protein